MLNITTIIFAIMLCFVSCKESTKQHKHQILKIPKNSKAAEKTIAQIFNKIEIIPLQATEESYLGHVKKIKAKDDTLFIYDAKAKAIFIFDAKGKYINKIHRLGKSKEEYLHPSDFEINTATNTLLLLDAMGWINEYDFKGRFIKRYSLPKPPYNYHRIVMYNSTTCALFSVANGDDYALNFFDLNQNVVTNSYFKNSGVWGSFIVDDVFHKYNNELYYHESLCGKVYKVSPQGYDLAYEWDLGVLPIDPERLLKPIAKREDHQKIVKDYIDGVIPFSFTNQLQSDKYYCTTTMGSKQELTTYLYNKQTNEFTILKEKNSGVIRIIPKYINNDFMLGLVNSKDDVAFREYVKDSNIEVLGNIENESNPLLIKLFWR